MRRTYIIAYNAEIKQRLLDHLKIWLALPQSNYLQKIDKLVLKPKPQSNYRDQHKNQINYWQINKRRFKLQLTFNYQNTFRKPNIKIEKIDQKKLNAAFKHRYTKIEKFIEQSPMIKTLAHQIAGKDNQYNAALKIFKWVIKNFTYQYPPLKRGAANLDLKNLCGDCGEYSGMFVALCRAIGIPARVDTGFWFNQKKLKLNEHAWASIYLHPYGWLPVD